MENFSKLMEYFLKVVEHFLNFVEFFNIALIGTSIALKAFVERESKEVGILQIPT